LSDLEKQRLDDRGSRQIIHALFGQPSEPSDQQSMRAIAAAPLGARHDCETSTGVVENSCVDLGRCYLRLANLPNFALDRLSRYEAALCRQVAQTLFALDTLDRRKPQHRAGDLVIDIDCARRMAQGIAGAQPIELPGIDHLNRGKDIPDIIWRFSSDAHFAARYRSFCGHRRIDRAVLDLVSAIIFMIAEAAPGLLPRK
jgi:hypothetical protein